MKTSAIHVEGQIISPEIFDRLDSNEISGQLAQDFGFQKGTRIKDEITTAWADARDQWNIFKRRIEKLAESDSGTTETRKYWIVPLIEFLGYNIILSKAEEVNGNSFSISHRAQNLDGFPVHIVGINDRMDLKKEGTRLSPHALVQEYLNITEHTYGIATNGYQLRLLRDSGKLIRLTYMEFDLLQMMEDDLFAEFSIMYRLLHASRMPQKYGEGDLSIIEKYHQASLEAGARIREGLSGAVERSILIVANGFLKHPANEELRLKLKDGKLEKEKYFQHLLRFIYRILFLMVLEERDIIYPKEKNEKLDYFRDIYNNFYSITRLRKLADNIFFFDEKLDDLWIALRTTFKIFGSEKLAGQLGIYPLDGDLFDYDSLGILSESGLDNHTLLQCIRNLSLFENPRTKNITHVNYAALNVEEFGSVYEGLLEKDPEIVFHGEEASFHFIKGSGRSSSGSHYTPEELVQPLIKHSLDYVIEDKLKEAAAGGKGLSSEELKKTKEKALLSIKVCDVACGSGHILLSAARRIAQELTKVRTGEEQPAPGPFRHAIRDVINNCIYGVDKNPLAVELCKVALWLEAHNPGMPLNFLDHKIKCGDSIVGLARIEELQNGISTEAFKRLPDDDKDVSAFLRKQNTSESKNRDQYTLSDKEEVIEKLNKISVTFKNFNELPDNTVEAVKKKADEHDVLKGPDWWMLKEIADLQVAQFFIHKTESNKPLIVTDKDYYRIFAGERVEHERQISTARAVAAEKKFFHWFLEFPEVFQLGGFDCILGNPPFLGNRALSGTFGDNFLNWVKNEYFPAGSCDLVTYFFRRIFELLKNSGFQALLATNTIAQGNAREGGLDVILRKGGTINYAVRSFRWPGIAAVEVSLVGIHKGNWNSDKFIGNNKVRFISSYLDDLNATGDPIPLKENNNKSFIGSFILGRGFILEPNEASRLIKKNSKNKEVLFPYLNGEDLNTHFDQSPSRWIINFFDWSEEFCKTNYTEVFEILERLVKPERTRKDDNNNFVLRKPLPEKWWIYADKRPSLYRTITGFEKILVIAQVSKTVAFSFVENNKVFDSKLTVFAMHKYHFFAILQSNVHYHWAWKYCTTMKTDLTYTPSTIFEPFPFPPNLAHNIENELESIGHIYHEYRHHFMLDTQLGLTKTYNLFHNPECISNNIESAKEIKEFKQANFQIPLDEAVCRIEKLRDLHKHMDEAVLAAYSWTDINLAHDFYEVDYLPENDRIRYTISPEARKEILRRLLELNHKIHAEEVAAGLWDKKGGKKINKQNSNYDSGRLFEDS